MWIKIKWLRIELTNENYISKLYQEYINKD